MRELEASLQQFGEFILTARLVTEKAAPYCVRWVRRFLTRAASDEPLADQVRTFCEALEGEGRWADWQVRQAEHALRSTSSTSSSALTGRRSHRAPSSTNGVTRVPWSRSNSCVAGFGHATTRTARSAPTSIGFDASWTTSSSSKACPIRESSPRASATSRPIWPSIDACRPVRQNQALSAVLFLCREVLGLEVDNLGLAARAKRGIHLPVVLSMPETAALLGAMSGTTWLMAALIYGGGLRVSECCELRIKDLDFDQGLVFVRDGKGGKDRSTLLAELARPELRGHLQRAEAQYRADRAAGLAGVWMPDSLDRNIRTRAASSVGSGCFPVARCRRIRGRASCAGITSATL